MKLLFGHSLLPQCFLCFVKGFLYFLVVAYSICIPDSPSSSCSYNALLRFLALWVLAHWYSWVDFIWKVLGIPKKRGSQAQLLWGLDSSPSPFFFFFFSEIHNVLSSKWDLFNWIYKQFTDFLRSSCPFIIFSWKNQLLVVVHTLMFLQVSWTHFWTLFFVPKIWKIFTFYKSFSTPVALCLLTLWSRHCVFQFDFSLIFAR